jgi:hypothetical protein
MIVDRTFHLITLDAEAACAVENQILKGIRTHFGLDGQVLGMIVFNPITIHSLNVPVETIESLCLTLGQSLELRSKAREKIKTYDILYPEAEV